MSGSLRIDRYIFEGKLTGAVCDFTINVTETPQNAGVYLSAATLLAGLGGNKKSGFVVFASDGRSATYVELAAGKIGKLKQATKTELLLPTSLE
jgi:hypothetical protein